MTVLRVKEQSPANRNYVVDLRDHHCQCELNFFMLMKMLPGCRENQKFWSFTIGDKRELKVQIKLLDYAPYTSTVEIIQQHKTKQYIAEPRILVRLYHDAEMAEIVAWDNHRYWHPQYEYPNKQMYQADEKLVLNRFLGEWLLHCRKQGIYVDNIVNSFSLR